MKPPGTLLDYFYGPVFERGGNLSGIINNHQTLNIEWLHTLIELDTRMLKVV